MHQLIRNRRAGRLLLSGVIAAALCGWIACGGGNTPKPNPGPPSGLTNRAFISVDGVAFGGANGHIALVDVTGDNASASAIAAGVASALYNTAESVLVRLDDGRRLTDLRRCFEERDPQDATAADRIIDWLMTHGMGTDEWVETLLRRLDDVLSRPATEQ